MRQWMLRMASIPTVGSVASRYWSFIISRRSWLAWVLSDMSLIHFQTSWNLACNWICHGYILGIMWVCHLNFSIVGYFEACATKYLRSKLACAENMSYPPRVRLGINLNWRRNHMILRRIQNEWSKYSINQHNYSKCLLHDDCHSCSCMDLPFKTEWQTYGLSLLSLPCFQQVQSSSSPLAAPGTDTNWSHTDY